MPMARDIDATERHSMEEPSRSASERPVETNRETDSGPAPSRERSGRIGRNYAYQVSAAELETMYDIGRFRTVAVADLAKERYAGRACDMRADLRSLADQGLIQKRTIWTERNKAPLAVAVLTKRGKELLEREFKDRQAQQLFAGFVKPAEVAHDAAIYRMFRAEAARIEKAGGRISRVVLDYELKKNLYSPLAKAKALPPLEYAKRQAEVAKENGLKVIEGKIPLPDLRIEYETSSGEASRVDLELATHHYHGSHLQTKAEAGFKMYAPDDSAGRLKAVLDEREITAAILSL
jgi:hypothetical protein